MNTVDDVVLSVVRSFVRDSVLFTALDVSNKVKETHPLARHREVRDLVRSLYSSEIESAGYARTPITVKLEDGTTAEALLYHSLADSWDLDAKYDAQKREQTATRPSVSVQAVQAAAAVIANPANLTVPVAPANFTVPVVVKSSPKVDAPPASTTTPTANATPSNSRLLWESLFKSQPSLFPRQ